MHWELHEEVQELNPSTKSIGLSEWGARRAGSGRTVRRWFRRGGAARRLRQDALVVMRPIGQVRAKIGCRKRRLASIIAGRR